jgi:hypothetical protein
MLTRSERLALALCSFVGIASALVTIGYGVGYTVIVGTALRRVLGVLG